MGKRLGGDKEGPLSHPGRDGGGGVVTSELCLEGSLTALEDRLGMRHEGQ